MNQPVNPQMNPQMNLQNPPPYIPPRPAGNGGKKKGNGCLIAVLVAVVVLIGGCALIGGLASSLLGGSSSSSSKKSEKREERTEDTSTSSSKEELDTTEGFSSEGVTSNDDIPFVNPEKPFLGTDVEDVLSEETINEYMAYFEPADDEFDGKYANDHNDPSDIGLPYVTVMDSCAYEKVFGKADVTLADIQDALNRNNNISQYYKDFIYEYAKDIRELYPNANLSVLHYNLDTLIIDEVTPSELEMETLSDGGAAACYIAEDNRICVLEGTDFSKESEEYIILAHELTHAARRIIREFEDGSSLRTKYWPDLKFGYFIEEAVITNEMYKLQGLDRKSIYYPVFCGYLRIIQDCTGYDGEDYFNHSVNELVEAMDEYMGDENYAYQILARIDAQATLKYESRRVDPVDFYDMRPLYEYLVRMYCKKYITEGMTKEEAEEVFNAFYEEVAFESTPTVRDTYEMYPERFRPAFDAYLEEVGIQ